MVWFKVEELTGSKGVPPESKQPHESRGNSKKRAVYFGYTRFRREPGTLCQHQGCNGREARDWRWHCTGHEACWMHCGLQCGPQSWHTCRRLCRRLCCGDGRRIDSRLDRWYRRWHLSKVQEAVTVPQSVCDIAKQHSCHRQQCEQSFGVLVLRGLVLGFRALEVSMAGCQTVYRCREGSVRRLLNSWYHRGYV